MHSFHSDNALVTGRLRIGKSYDQKVKTKQETSFNQLYLDCTYKLVDFALDLDGVMRVDGND